MLLPKNGFILSVPRVYLNGLHLHSLLCSIPGSDSSGIANWRLSQFCMYLTESMLPGNYKAHLMLRKILPIIILYDK